MQKYNNTAQTYIKLNIHTTVSDDTTLTSDKSTVINHSWVDRIQKNYKKIIIIVALCFDKRAKNHIINVFDPLCRARAMRVRTHSISWGLLVCGVHVFCVFTSSHRRQEHRMLLLWSTAQNLLWNAAQSPIVAILGIPASPFSEWDRAVAIHFRSMRLFSLSGFCLYSAIQCLDTIDWEECLSWVCLFEQFHISVFLVGIFILVIVLV